MINATELAQVLSANNIRGFSAEEIISNADFIGNSKISYTEFLSITLKTQEFVTQEKLSHLFADFD